MPDAETAVQAATMIWRAHIRYMGVGTMLVGGLWTLFTLAKPVVSSITTSLYSLREMRLGKTTNVLRTERDIPIHYVMIAVGLILIPIFFMIAHSIIPSDMNISLSYRYAVSAFSTVYILVGGFIFCSIMAYFAGLIGSTNSPVSGLLVSSLLLLCLILIGCFGFGAGDQAMEMLGAVVAIGATVVIGAALSISNDTMQDLKVGEIVGATPWKQQVMLVLGVVVSAFVIPPILQLLYNAYGIGGVFPRPGMNPAHMLAAPQAGLMAAVAKGAFSHQLEWAMIGTGAVIAVICIFFDEILKRLGIYLPLDSSVPCVIGGILAYLVQSRLNNMYHRGRANDEVKVNAHRHRGLLLSCGIVAGASLMGVVLAIPFAIKQSADALRIMPEAYMPFAGVLSVAVTFLLCAWIYRVVLKRD
jgi:putative OPT family oligopeptide transporter